MKKEFSRITTKQKVIKGIQGVEAMLQDTGAEGKDNTFRYFVTHKLVDFLYFQSSQDTW